MSGTGEVREGFAGEERLFRIRLGEIRRIEAKCGNVGIGEVVRRLSKAVFLLDKVGGVEAFAHGLEIRADDVFETIFQGLKGGGMADREATDLVRREIDDRGWSGLLDHVGLALQVLTGTQATPEGDDQGEPKAEATPATPKRRSTSKSSTASGRPSG